mmetsp:Transcript_88322/g.189690  ORF Transcript_88322/g.189690 Transcript_88322/m.189690 type:complete len:291 (+) Transcript_88322:1029-1901(+)
MTNQLRTLGAKLRSTTWRPQGWRRHLDGWRVAACCGADPCGSPLCLPKLLVRKHHRNLRMAVRRYAAAPPPLQRGGCKCGLLEVSRRSFQSLLAQLSCHCSHQEATSQGLQAHNRETQPPPASLSMPRPRHRCDPCGSNQDPRIFQPHERRFPEEDFGPSHAHLFLSHTTTPHRITDRGTSCRSAVVVLRQGQSFTTSGPRNPTRLMEDENVPLQEDALAASVTEAKSAYPCGLQKAAVATLPQHRSVVEDERHLGVIRPQAADVAALTGLERCAELVQLGAEGRGQSGP